MNELITVVTVESVNAWTGIGTMIGVIVLGIMNKLASKRADIASTDAATGLREAAKLAVDTHTLVNSNMGIQLRKSMLQSRRIAELTKEPVDIANADEDERLYLAHVERQRVVD